MSDPGTAPEDSAAAVDPAPPAEQPLIPCDRCGTFIQGEPQQVQARQLCKACAVRLRAELEERKLYSYWYLIGVGLLLNPTLTAILAAINWKRLGQPFRMWTSIVVTVITAAWTANWLYSGDVPSIPLKLLGALVVIAVSTQGMKPLYQKHLAVGGGRASGFLPVLIVVVVVLSPFCISDIMRW